MADIWQEHVSLEITNAVGDDQRMLEIAQALIQFDRLGLIPLEILEPLTNKISQLNGD